MELFLITRLRRIRACLTGLPWLLALYALPAAAGSEPVSEQALKAALLFKLPPFVYRADGDRTAPTRICLLGKNPFGVAPEKLAQQPVDGRSVKYLRLANTAEVSGCDFLFISRSEADALAGILSRLRYQRVVTVSDIEGFAMAGGMVELALAGSGTSVSILINRKAAQRQNIEFNAQLLRLAKLVEPAQ